jgi:hypothetical protein
MDSKMSYYCHVCGLENEFEIDDYDICECCAHERCCDGTSPESVRQYREKWLKNGAKWLWRRTKPANWDLQAQLRNIPLEFQ